MYGKMMMAKAPAKAGKKAAPFKPCAGCPNKAKCSAMGKCMKAKAKYKNPSVVTPRGDLSTTKGASHGNQRGNHTSPTASPSN